MNNWKKATSLGLVMTLCAGTLAGCGESTSENTSGKNLEIPSELEEMVSHSIDAGKIETVYVIKDADGNTQETIVSEWLKNEEGSKVLKDVSNLDNIEVVKGNATYTENDNGELEWVTEGSDIYYQGTSDKALPVDVSVSYELDGKKVSADELEGATGHLVMTFNYENNTKEEVTTEQGTYTVYDPYAMISGTMFDNKEAANITVEGGSYMNDGDRIVVYGMAFPGLEESLGLKDAVDSEGELIDIKIPEKVVIEADITNFSKPVTITAATCNALDKIDLDNLDSKEDLEEKMNELSDGMAAVVDGATSLSDGMVELGDGEKAIEDGVTKLNNGAKDLNDGAKKVNDGAVKVNDGAVKVNDGAQKLSDGLSVLNTGATKLNAGTITLKEGMEQLKNSAPALSQGVSDLNSGANLLSTGMNTLVSNNDTLTAGSKTLLDGVTLLNSNLNNPQAMMQLSALSTGSDEFMSGLSQLSAGMAQVTAGYSCAEGTDLGNALAGLTQYAQAIQTTDPVTAATILAVVQSYKDLYSYEAAFSGSVSTLNDNYGAIDGGVDSLITNLTTIAGAVNEVQAGAAALNTGIVNYTAGASELAAGTESLAAGTKTLNDQVPTLVDGITALYDGSVALESGSKEIADGAAALSTGSKDLVEGTTALADGTSALCEGTKTLQGGTETLADGTKALDEGMKTLTDGIAQLVSGSAQLKDGVIKLNEEGIEKLTSLVVDNLDKYFDRIETLKDLSKNNSSYAGCREDVECSSIYIFKTE